MTPEDAPEVTAKTTHVDVHVPTSDADAAADTGDERLATLLEEACSKADEYQQEMLRARADLENTRKRAQREVENAHKYAVEKLLGDLLPVKDSIELGLAAAESSQEVASLREGMQLTLKMLEGLLEKHGVTEVNPVGEKFSHDYHQAMTMQESTEAEPGTVLNVIQKGYLLNDRLVRPAMVVVAK